MLSWFFASSLQPTTRKSLKETILREEAIILWKNDAAERWKFERRNEKGETKDYALRNKIKRINNFEREEFVVCQIWMNDAAARFVKWCGIFEWMNDARFKWMMLLAFYTNTILG